MLGLLLWMPLITHLTDRVDDTGNGVMLVECFT